MNNFIESAKSNRSKCRSCQKKIEKDTFRLCEEVVNTFDPDGGTTYHYHHLECAAKSKPMQLIEALNKNSEVPNKDELLIICEQEKKNKKPSTFPYAEHSPSGRAKCILCEEKIEKDELRIAVEREVDTGSFVAAGPGYLHPECANEYTEDTDLLSKIKTNSTTLTEDDLVQLTEALK